jgi:hypothetical protein
MAVLSDRRKSQGDPEDSTRCKLDDSWHDGDKTRRNICLDNKMKAVLQHYRSCTFDIERLHVPAAACPVQCIENATRPETPPELIAVQASIEGRLAERFILLFK